MDKNQTGTEKMTYEQICKHYGIEKHLANKLRNSSKEERRVLYRSLYNELFQKIPNHTLLKKKNSVFQQKYVLYEMGIIKPFLHDKTIFLEIGAGDCCLSFEVAKNVKKVYAIDVSDEITRNVSCPEKFELIISDGLTVNVPPNSIDVAYSNHVIEHIHPDDIVDHLRNILTSLISGGIYICNTPHRFMGPSDISKHFDKIATGFHLKEYINRELGYLFKKAGFSKVEILVGARKKYINMEMFPIILLESTLEKFPYLLRKSLSRSKIFRHLLGIRMIGIK